MQFFLMLSTSSLILTISFFSLGFWFFYHNIIKKLPVILRGVLMMNRIGKPNLKKLDIEIQLYVDILNKDTNETSQLIIRNLLYLKILSRDITSLTIILKKEKDKNSRNILARTLASLLYEFYSDINNLYDKKFQNEIVKNLSPNMYNVLKDVKKMTGTMGNFYFERLKTIRMNVGSHRDFDVLKQVQIIESVSSDEIIKIANSTAFTIYFFTVFHTSFTAQTLVKLNLRVPKIEPFTNLERDLKLWGELI